MKKVISTAILITTFLIGALAVKAQVIVDGNPACSDLNLGSVASFKVQPPQAGVHTYAITGIGNITTNVVAAPTNATPSVVSFNASSPFVRAFIVKAGTRANVYTYNPPILAAVNLLSPIDANGNFPGLSHLDVCYSVDTTAAPANIDGVVLSSEGRPVYGATVTTTREDGTVLSVRTNPFGYFTLTDLEVGHTYIVNTRAKGYTFNPSVVNLFDSIVNFTIVAN